MGTRVVVAIALLVAVAAACTRPPGEFAEVSVDAAMELFRAGAARPVDANSPKVRRRFGTIPGAVLLSGYESYDPAVELPADRSEKLVFYCTDRNCPASRRAAERAVAAGWQNVSVLRAGIKGWIEAGHSVVPGQRADGSAGT